MGCCASQSSRHAFRTVSSSSLSNYRGDAPTASLHEKKEWPQEGHVNEDAHADETEEEEPSSDSSDGVAPTVVFARVHNSPCAGVGVARTATAPLLTPRESPIERVVESTISDVASAGSRSSTKDVESVLQPPIKALLGGAANDGNASTSSFFEPSDGGQEACGELPASSTVAAAMADSFPRQCDDGKSTHGGDGDATVVGGFMHVFTVLTEAQLQRALCTVPVMRIMCNGSHSRTLRCARCPKCKHCTTHTIMCDADASLHVPTCSLLYCQMDVGPAAILQRVITEEMELTPKNVAPLHASLWFLSYAAYVLLHLRFSRQAELFLLREVFLSMQLLLWAGMPLTLSTASIRGMTGNGATADQSSSKVAVPPLHERTSLEVTPCDILFFPATFSHTFCRIRLGTPQNSNTNNPPLLKLCDQLPPFHHIAPQEVEALLLDRDGSVWNSFLLSDAETLQFLEPANRALCGLVDLVGAIISCSTNVPLLGC